MSRGTYAFNYFSNRIEHISDVQLLVIYEVV